MFEEEDPAIGKIFSPNLPVVIPPWEEHAAIPPWEGHAVIPMKLTMVEYAQLTGQEQLEWWSAGGELKV